MYGKKLIASLAATLLATVVMMPTASAIPSDPEPPSATAEEPSETPQSSQADEADSTQSDGAQSAQSGESIIDNESDTTEGPAPDNQSRRLLESLHEQQLEDRGVSLPAERIPQPMTVQSEANKVMPMAVSAVPSFAARKTIGGGWHRMIPVFGGNGDNRGVKDLYGINPDTGALYFYPRWGGGAFDPALQVGTEWTILRQVTGGVDFTGDGLTDLLGIDSAAKLRLYKGIGDGKVSYSHNIGIAGWDRVRLVAAVPNGPGGKPCIYAVHNDGYIYYYTTDGRGKVTDSGKYGPGWDQIRLIIGTKDWNGDGTSDLFAVRNDGKLFLYLGSSGGLSNAGQVGVGWNIMTHVVAGETVNGAPALWATDAQGRLFEYGRAGSEAPDIVTLARKHIGKPYVYGAAGPNTFDCSGLVSYVYREAGTPFRPWRLSSEQIRNVSRPIPRSAARPGDILWWPGHVAIYIGGGKVIHAPKPGTKVREDWIWGNPTYLRYPR